MATNEALAQGLRAVQRVLSSEGFIQLAAGGAALKDCHTDPEGTLRRRGIALPEAIRRVEMKVRHTPPLARQRGLRGLRGGNFEWRFHVQVGEQSWRVIHLCDAWPMDVADAAADAEAAEAAGDTEPAASTGLGGTS